MITVMKTELKQDEKYEEEIREWPKDLYEGEKVMNRKERKRKKAWRGKMRTGERGRGMTWAGNERMTKKFTPERWWKGGEQSDDKYKEN